MTRAAATTTAGAEARPVTTAHPAGVTHPERVLWPAERITKGDLISYYLTVADVVLAHVRGRPVVMKPYPQGITGKSYYRQTLPQSAPVWLSRYRHIAQAGRRANEMAVIDDERALVWLANQAAIELHPWLSRIDAPDRPDFVVFDLDVQRLELFPRALAVARLVADELEVLGLRGYAKTSGGDGVHVYVPLERGAGYDKTRAWARALAERLERRHPELVSTDSTIAGRETKVLVDYSQNSLGRTTVAAYSVRPRPGATVSTPLTWQEVKQGSVRPTDFTIRTVPDRLAQYGDLFEPVLRGGPSLVPLSDSQGE
jgi:bifunctional non-homologous end joining protein LigD